MVCPNNVTKGEMHAFCSRQSIIGWEQDLPDTDYNKLFSHKMEDVKMPKELKKTEYTMGDDELV
jgi:hypothetical protein